MTHRTITLLLRGGVFAFLIGCGTDESPGDSPSPPSPGTHAVSRSTVGSAWPFVNIESGTVVCEGDAAIFEAGGNRYALNGVAKSRHNLPYPHEAGIVQTVPVDSTNPSLGTRNADVEVLRRKCN